jgi:hypothetical protein
VLDDSLRTVGEHCRNTARTVFDGLVIFRRVCTSSQAEDPSPAGRALSSFVLGSAARVYDVHMQGIWWAALAGDRDPASPSRQAPASRLTSWAIPPARLARATDATRTFTFRSDAARWYVTHAGATLQVLEDGHALRGMGAVESVASAASGGWARWRDELTIKSSDGSDPRLNGRKYALVVPSHVAWAESQPFGERHQGPL